MRKLRMKDKKSLYLVLGILMFSMLCAPALAGRYDYDGYPLETIKNGTGDVYVSCGNNAGLQGTSYQNNTFVTTFTNVPTDIPADNIKWAMLKVGVYGANTSRAGWMNASLNNTLLDENNNPDKYLNVTPPSNISPVNMVNASGTGLYLVDYDVTDVLRSINTSTITATIRTWPDLTWGNSYRLDGRVYGAVLIVVYNDGSSSQYWINEGNVNLHKNATVWVNGSSTLVQDFNANRTDFNGPVSSSLNNATLTVGYFAGDSSQDDYLYFNVPNDENSPYDLTNFNWNIPDHNEWKLDNNNVANATCDGIGYTYSFDLHTFNATAKLDKEDDNNYAIFWRGHGNDDDPEIFDPAYPGVNPETESYLSPFLAVLKVTP